MKDTPQIKAIMKAIAEGKCKNQYAALNKIKQLRVKLNSSNRLREWNNYLSQ